MSCFLFRIQTIRTYDPARIRRVIAILMILLKNRNLESLFSQRILSGFGAESISRILVLNTFSLGLQQSQHPQMTPRHFSKEVEESLSSTKFLEFMVANVTQAYFIDDCASTLSMDTNALLIARREPSIF